MLYWKREIFICATAFQDEFSVSRNLINELENNTRTMLIVSNTTIPAKKHLLN